MVEESHLPAVNCVSFADRIRTPRTKRQRQRKSLRKSARLSKTREESCPAECCSVMWGNRVTLRTLFFFSNRWQWPLFNMSRLSALFKMVSWEEKYLISKPLVGMMSIIFFKANEGFGVLDIWNILVGGREIFFFLLPLGGWSVSSGLEDGLLFSRSAANVSTQQSHFSYWSKGFYGHVSFICCVVGVCEAEVWRLHHSGHPQPSRTIGGRWVQSGSP